MTWWEQQLFDCCLSFFVVVFCSCKNFFVVVFCNMQSSNTCAWSIHPSMSQIFLFLALIFNFQITHTQQNGYAAALFLRQIYGEWFDLVWFSRAGVMCAAAFCDHILHRKPTDQLSHVWLFTNYITHVDDTDECMREKERREEQQSTYLAKVFFWGGDGLMDFWQCLWRTLLASTNCVYGVVMRAAWPGMCGWSDVWCSAFFVTDQFIHSFSITFCGDLPKRTTNFFVVVLATCARLNHLIKIE